MERFTLGAKVILIIMIDVLEKIIDYAISNKVEIAKIVEEEIKLLHSLSREKWALSIKNHEGIRIHFAGLIIFTITKDHIWMSVNPDTLLIGDTDYWEWEKLSYQEYRKYKSIKIRNGILKRFNDTETLEKIKTAHIDVVRNIASKDYKLLDKTIANHNNEIVFLLNEKYNLSIPYPEFSFKKEFRRNEDILNNLAITPIDVTERETFVKNRIGQDIFRSRLLSKYKRCILCGIENEILLRASHIKPWSRSENIEKLDLANGLLLCANHDSLFDKGLISFDKNGNIILSSKISEHDRKLLDLIKEKKIFIDDNMKKYMDWHRENIWIQ